MKPPVYTFATAETLTSVSQVTDVSDGDLFYKDMQSLIEKYGVAGLTEDKKLSPAKNLSPAAYRTITQSALAQLRQMASKTGMGGKRFGELFGEGCAAPNAAGETILAGNAVSSLKCTFGPQTLSAIYPEKAMSRGYFIQLLRKALDHGSDKISSNSSMNLGPTNLKASPAEIKELIDKGQQLMAAKKYDDAIRYFNQVLDYDSNNIDAYRFRGLSALLIYDQNPQQRQKLYTAVFNFDEVIKRGSTNADDHYMRGLAHARLGSKEKAIADLRSALKFNPNHTGAKDSLAALGVKP